MTAFLVACYTFPMMRRIIYFAILTLVVTALFAAGAFLYYQGIQAVTHQLNYALAPAIVGIVSMVFALLIPAVEISLHLLYPKHKYQ